MLCWPSWGYNSELKLVYGDDEIGKEKSRICGIDGEMVIYMESESCNLSSGVIVSTLDGA